MQDSTVKMEKRTGLLSNHERGLSFSLQPLDSSNSIDASHINFVENRREKRLTPPNRRLSSSGKASGPLGQPRALPPRPERCLKAGARRVIPVADDPGHAPPRALDVGDVRLSDLAN